MRHFTTLEGETLGTLFCGTNGRTLMQTKTEEKLMWSLNETEFVSEEGWTGGTLGEMMNLFLSSHRCTKEELMSRGWGEERFTEGLSMRLGVSNEGKTFLKR